MYHKKSSNLPFKENVKSGFTFPDQGPYLLRLNDQAVFR